ncbi:uncharacterized protein LOC113468603 [Diaphorina citri]|uniref:Uncharacterized protein LOC113468603 n=1 Tax=Diaphorina citri TaxID=121845 RepID=A0A3Q0J414_DIACI|nr:uncharacterized protein LOC113468603 [Diaphorina citri]
MQCVSSRLLSIFAFLMSFTIVMTFLFYITDLKGIAMIYSPQDYSLIHSISMILMFLSSGIKENGNSLVS